MLLLLSTSIGRLVGNIEVFCLREVGFRPAVTVRTLIERQPIISRIAYPHTETRFYLEFGTVKGPPGRYRDEMSLGFTRTVRAFPWRQEVDEVVSGSAKRNLFPCFGTVKRPHGRHETINCDYFAICCTDITSNKLCAKPLLQLCRRLWRTNEMHIRFFFHQMRLGFARTVRALPERLHVEWAVVCRRAVADILRSLGTVKGPHGRHFGW